MEERQVTVDGTTHRLQSPFLVIATQNNVGTAGTQLLPFAQLDRFLMRLSLGYPDMESQMAIIRDRQQGNPIDGVQQVLSKENVLEMQNDVTNVTLKDSVIKYIAQIAEASRGDHRIELGISPRGALFIARAAKARAYVQGRDYAVPEDVREVLTDVCAHRVILSGQAKAGKMTEAAVLQHLLDMVSPPDGRKQ
jgi:MoxR-like ATPase